MPSSTPFRLLSAGAFALVLSLAACGDDDAGSAGNASSADGADSAEGAASGEDVEAPAVDAVEILDFIFTPESIVIDAGTEITFTNLDGTAHTATARDGSFNTEEIAGGAEASVTLDTPGEYAYFCAFHPFMEGTVVVE